MAKLSPDIDILPNKMDVGGKIVLWGIMSVQRTQIIIVRHGQTEWNIRGIRQGYLDSRLTERGVAQAKALGAASGAGKIHGAL